MTDDFKIIALHEHLQPSINEQSAYFNKQAARLKSEFINMIHERDEHLEDLRDVAFQHLENLRRTEIDIDTDIDPLLTKIDQAANELDRAEKELELHRWMSWQFEPLLRAI